jgi:hypothetical protein
MMISGCSNSGDTMIYDMVHSSATGPVYMPNQEVSALNTYNRFDRNILTRRPLDVFNIADIEKEFGSIRELIHLILVRDPRDLVSLKHSVGPSQYLQGYDYQLFVQKDYSSFSAPGIAAVANAIKEAETLGRRIYVVRYEDLVRDIESVRRLIAFATGFPLTNPFPCFRETDILDDLAATQAECPPNEASDQPEWTKGDRFKRALKQLQLFPEMEELAVRWGYLPTERYMEKYRLPLPDLQQERGTIIAFHTDDEIYRHEANRFTRRLDQLGLKYDITVVPPRGEWVENCAMKSEFIRDARKRLRGPLLYFDVDAFVHKDPWPYLSLYDGHVAAYIHSDGELISSTILLNDSPETLDLIEQWVSEQRLRPKDYDQRVLQDIVERDEQSERSRFSFQRLPPNFCYIPGKKYSSVFGDIIVEQLQVSRVTKRGRRGDLMEQRIAELDAALDRT